ncbi:MAG: endo-1,4-beta-xylanase [Pirellulales bacterium]
MQCWIKRSAFSWLVVICLAPLAVAQSFTGSSLSHRSSGSGSGNWTLSQNGYVGTYFTLAEAGPVTIGASAAGSTNDAVAPRMNFVIADTKTGFDVAPGFTNYEHTFHLPAGTYFARTEFANDVPTANRQLTLANLSISGATSVNNSTSNSSRSASALAAADTYIENFRKGNVHVGLSGVAPGTSVGVRLKRHDFNFGTAVAGSSYLRTPGTPGANANAAQYQQALADSRFNSLSPENDGKWGSNESTRDSNNMSSVDLMLNFADAHDMRFRQHNLIWGPNNSGNNNQQPNWAHTMLQDPDGIDPVSGMTRSEALRDEISERIDYYVADRAHRYYEIDVYNESYHTGSNNNSSANTYWDEYGVDGIAGIYKEAKDAVEAAGGNALLYVNEYNVLQAEGGDFYANWYARHTENLRDAGKQAFGEDIVDGIGFQYYANTGHNAGRSYAVMQNLAVQDLPMHLTEFGISSSTTDEATQANILNESLRLVFGMHGTTGFTMWGFWAGAVWTGAPNGVLYNSNWTLRQAGQAWQALQEEWDTDLTLEVGPDGTIAFDGFWGDYELVIDGQTYELGLAKGQSLYSLVVAPGDFNGDGLVDAVDYTIWRDTLGSTTDFRADGNGDRLIDEADYALWKSYFGTDYTAGGQGATTVPEPASAILLLLAGAITASRSRNRTRRSRPAR